MKPIDFQGIANFDQALIEQLHSYLFDNEEYLAKRIMHSIPPAPGVSLSSSLQERREKLRLKDAVQGFGKSVATAATSQEILAKPNDWEAAVRQVNTALWEYVELLEGCATELFQQLNQIGFEYWHGDLMNTIEQAKQSLLRQMKECEWLMDRIEPLLWDYRKICEEKSQTSSWWKKILYFGSSLVDRSLYSYLRKSRRFLNMQSKWFSQKYSGFHQLKEKIENASRKFKGYHVFSELNELSRKDFKKLYELLKLWHLNQKSKLLPPREPIRAIRSLFSVEHAAKVFNDYYCLLEEALYEKSRSIKVDSVDFYGDSTNRKIAADAVKGMRVEVHTLGATIENYRDFDLRTHPNPYIRSRWGFTEWVVGPEPEKTRGLLNLVYEMEFLDKLFEKFSVSLDKGPESNDVELLQNKNDEAARLLHEMGQPLSSRVMMRARAEQLVELLEEMNELGSFHLQSMDNMGKILSKAMRADWQYQVLFEMSSFHQLYRIHLGIVGPNTDQKHRSRLDKFKAIIAELQDWVKGCDTHRHVHEIETDMNDMRLYLQDFLAFVQRLSAEDELDAEDAKEQIAEIAGQLLEYRYVFGLFFHMLHQYEPEGKLIRNQFLFVDQYFEAVESRLHDICQK